MKKSKLFPPFLMLLAGAVASIVMYYFNYSTKQMLIILLCVLVVFYAVGSIIQKKITGYVQQILEQEANEGEVIEKEIPAEDREQTAEKEDAEEADEK